MFDSVALAWNAMAADFREGSQGKSSAATALHMMSGINALGVHDTPDEAILKGQEYINMELAASGGANGINLGNAVHAVQDKYSNAHDGADWVGSFSALGFRGGVYHIFKGTIPGFDNIAGAYNETKSLVGSAISGNPNGYLDSQFNVKNKNPALGGGRLGEGNE